MGQIIRVDFLFARLCRDVAGWYDKYYFGSDKDDKKAKHLNRLQLEYEKKEKFANDPELREVEIEVFLSHVQKKVWG